MSWLSKGWQVFDSDPAVEAWLETAGPAALAAASDPNLQANWLRCGGTWFAGVDALPNDADGRVGKGPPLSGAAFETATRKTGTLPLHRGQVSVTYPGYPEQSAGESDSAFRFRQRRDAAHLDGLLALGPNKQRFLKEPHAWILGYPVTECSTDAAPLVVWEGSHQVIRAHFRAAFAKHPKHIWPDLDLTDIYQLARRDVFDRCPRRLLPASPGQAILLHRMTIHGVAPWVETATAPVGGRAVIYFRPECPGGIAEWLDQP